MNVYDTHEIHFGGHDVEVFGTYEEVHNRSEDTVIFRAIVRITSLVSMKSKQVEYKTWSRKKLGHFDPTTSITSPDPKLEAIVNKFKKIGEKRTLLHIDTLIARYGEFTIS